MVVKSGYGWICPTYAEDIAQRIRQNLNEPIEWFTILWLHEDDNKAKWSAIIEIMNQIFLVDVHENGLKRIRIEDIYDRT